MGAIRAREMAHLHAVQCLRGGAEIADLSAEAGRRRAGTEADALRQGVVDETHVLYLPLQVPLSARQVGGASRGARRWGGVP